ncbi:MAG: FIST signal transduction protein [Actinomycetota bacterium]
MIRIGAGVSTQSNPSSAALEALDAARTALGGQPANLGFIFCSSHPAESMDLIVKALSPSLEGTTVIGCTTQTAIGGGREIEDQPAVSVWLGHLPGAELAPFELDVAETPDGLQIVGLPFVERSLAATFLLADPYTFPTQMFLQNLNQDYPDLPVLGGQAGGAGAGEVRLVLGDRVVTGGAVGVQVGGDVRVTPVISQGCRPIGSPYVVTKVQGNVIFQLGGKPPLNRLREILAKLSREDRARAAHNLHIGVVIDEIKADPQPGDFLIRPVFQADPENGAISVGEVLTVGQTVQFQVRDAEAADADLRQLMEQHVGRHGVDTTTGALLFTCNGRGFGLFGRPDHDIAAIRDALPELPVAGMFCGGEIGPIGGVNFLHGFTASIALFQEPIDL